LRFVKLIVSSYPAALIPPCSRRAGDAFCSLTQVAPYRIPRSLGGIRFRRDTH
jgi:hypothetical protein